MKIDDVKIGERYGANRWPRNAQRGRDLAEVEVLEVVKERDGHYSSARIIRQAKVRIVDDRGQWWTKTGKVVTLKAACLVPWDADTAAKQRELLNEQRNASARLNKALAPLGLTARGKTNYRDEPSGIEIEPVDALRISTAQANEIAETLERAL